MQIVPRWSTSLSQSIRRATQTDKGRRLSTQTYRSSSSIPQPTNERTVIDKDGGSRKRSKGWHLEDHLYEPAGTEQRVKPRIVEDDKSDLVDTRSLLNTLLAHQKANAQRVRIKLLPDNPENRNSPDSIHARPGIRSFKPRTNNSDITVKHLSLERQQHPEREDYEGVVRPLAYDWEIIKDVPRYFRLPWMRELDQQKPSREPARKRLTTEIQALNRFFSPTIEEQNAAQAALEDVRRVISERCSDIERVDLVGSRASGLATALSDLDLNLIVKPPSISKKEPRSDEAVLAGVWKTLRFGLPARHPVQMTYYAKMARIPIIAGIHASTGLEFQIQVANSAYGSLALVKALQAEWPTLQALFVTLKQTLQMRRLSKGQHGGITSYPLLNMIVVSLKHHQMDTDRYDVGKQLLQFIDFWAEMDFYTTGITHHPSRYLRGRLEEHEEDEPLTASNAVSLITQDPVAAVPVKFDVRKNLVDIHLGTNNYRMTLHDPANPHNDLGRSAHQIKHIQALLLHVQQHLKDDMAEWDRDIHEHGEAKNQPIALLRSLVEGDYSIYNLHRRRLLSSEREAYEQSMT